VPLNFGALPPERSARDTAKAVILPVPYDGTASYRTGARDGPRAVIEASRNMELYDEELRRNVSEMGIATLDELEPIMTSPAEMVNAVEAAVERCVSAGKFTVVLGGEHSITPGAVRAHQRHFPDLCVLQIDAHADLRDEYQRSRHSHACTTSRLLEICPVVQVGVRSFSRDEAEAVEARRDSIIFARDIRKTNDWPRAAVEKLGKNVYVTFDLDGLDPSIMPSVGTPEPGGLGWYEALELLRSVCEARRVVGFDVVELTPIPSNVAPDFLAARLVYKLMGYANFLGND